MAMNHLETEHKLNTYVVKTNVEFSRFLCIKANSPEEAESKAYKKITEEHYLENTNHTARYNVEEA